MKSTSLLLIAACIGAALTGGCLNLEKPTVRARHFALAAVEASDGATAGPAIGIAPVQVAGYLDHPSVALRRGRHEIYYRGDTLWAEAVDQGIQRVLAANLAARLGTDRVFLNRWSRAAVERELYLAVNRLDLREDGRAELEASWQWARPGNAPPLRHGSAALTVTGPAPGADMDGAIGSLSALLDQLAERVAQDIDADLGTNAPRAAAP